MRKIVPFAVIAVLAVIAAFLPGCDQLVTKENNYYDTVTLIVRDSTCVKGCHTDNIDSMAIAQRQWVNSAHSSDSLADYTRGLFNTRSCGPQCHNTAGFVRSLTGASDTTKFPTEIGCFACHKPHTSWDFSVRDSNQVTLVTNVIYKYGRSNICARCHKAIVTPTSQVAPSKFIDGNWGPHTSVQADMLAGTGGYELPDSTYPNSAHTLDDTTGCIACHQTFSRGFVLGGHTFKVSNGLNRLLEGCNIANCHAASNVSDFSSYDSLQVAYLASIDTLRSMLVAGNLLDSSGKPVQRSVITADSVGALYNYLFVSYDRSHGVHNTKYGLKLLRQSMLVLRNPAI